MKKTNMPISIIYTDMQVLLVVIISLSYLCRLLLILANSLDPDQARQKVGPDLDPNCLTL